MAIRATTSFLSPACDRPIFPVGTSLALALLPLFISVGVMFVSLFCICLCLIFFVSLLVFLKWGWGVGPTPTAWDRPMWVHRAGKTSGMHAAI